MNILNNRPIPIIIGMRCMISAMQRLLRCVVAPRFPFAEASWVFAKSFSNSGEKHAND